MSGDELLVIVGPTASGKTELAIRVAERDDGEVISADSVQVYRHFDIGSGKPSAEELARAPHHLIDSIEPYEPMDAARWAELAEAAIFDIRSRGRRPIVCGGSFLFVRALVWGLAAAPPADETIREQHRELAEREGRPALYELLKQRDPSRAEELNPNDFVRVSRALEIQELSGIPMSQWQREHGFRRQRHTARLVGVEHERSVLEERISRRVGAMLEAGWIEETRRLLQAGFADSRPMGAVGYRQVAAWLSTPDGERSSLDALHDEIYRATRIFARRQRTWLRDRELVWLPPGELPA